MAEFLTQEEIDNLLSYCEDDEESKEGTFYEITTKVFVNKEELLDKVLNKVASEFDSILDVSNRVPFSEVVIYKKSLDIFKEVIEEIRVKGDLLE